LVSHTEKHRPRVFENRALREICGSYKKVVTREWRRLHDEELRSLYRSPNILRVIKLRRLSWGDPKETDRLEHRWEDNIGVNLQEVKWDTCPKIKSRWRALVNVVMNFGFHKISFSGRTQLHGVGLLFFLSVLKYTDTYQINQLSFCANRKPLSTHTQYWKPRKM